ncbi:hypothetical protein GC175_21910 [bacterium]|nr:hypothetical protein [bacterium]
MKVQIVNSDVVNAAIFAASLLMVMVLGDALVYAWPKGVPTQLWALLDPPVHWVLALLIVSPLLSHPVLGRHLWLWVAVATVAAVLVDLDHFIAARSFSLADALALGSRPFAHSLLFVVAMAVVTWLVSREPVGALLVLVVLLSHIVRDGSHGGIPLWWPARGNVDIAVPLYYVLEIGLGWVVLWAAGRPSPAAWFTWIGTLLGR